MIESKHEFFHGKMGKLSVDAKEKQESGRIHKMDPRSLLKWKSFKV